MGTSYTHFLETTNASRRCYRYKLVRITEVREDEGRFDDDVDNCDDGGVQGGIGRERHALADLQWKGGDDEMW